MPVEAAFGGLDQIPIEPILRNSRLIPSTQQDRLALNIECECNPATHHHRRESEVPSCSGTSIPSAYPHSAGQVAVRIFPAVQPRSKSRDGRLRRIAGTQAKTPRGTQLSTVSHFP